MSGSKRRTLMFLGIAGVLILMGTGVKVWKNWEEREAGEREREARPPRNESGERRVRVTREQMEDQGIVLLAAAPAPLDISIDVPGDITLNADKMARVMPRFPGIVKQVFKSFGDKVEKGDLLAVIESNESLTPYEMKTPLAGTVVEKKITPGELLQAESPAFIIADLKNVWLDLGIFPQDLQRIKVGQEVFVSSAAGGFEAQGRISFLDPVARGDSRALHARVVLPNPEGKWKPGLFVQAKIVVDRMNAEVTVPKEAVQTLDGKPCVFRKTAQGIEPAFPRLGRADDRRIEVIEGLRAGDSVVVGNAFLIKSELEKASFSDEEDGD